MRWLHRTRDTAPAESGAPPRGDPPGPDDGERAAILERWRRAEQRVARTWSAWLAAAPADAVRRYEEHRRALGEEERAAAELELASRPLTAGRAEAGMAGSARQ